MAGRVRVLLLVVIGSGYFSAGCVSYMPDTSRQATTSEIAGGGTGFVRFEVEGVRLEIAPLDTRDLANAHLDIDPNRVAMLPVYMEITNLRSAPIRLEPDNMIVTLSGGDTVSSIDFHTVLDRARRSAVQVVPAYLVFGLVGMAASSANATSTNKKLDTDFERKRLQPRILRSGKKAKGIVFFDISEHSVIDPIELQLSFTDLETGAPIQLHIDTTGAEAKSEGEPPQQETTRN